MNGPHHKNKDNKKAGKDMVLLYLYHLFSNDKKGGKPEPKESKWLFTVEKCFVSTN